MAENNDIFEKIQQAGITISVPEERNYRLVGLYNGISKRYLARNEEYEQNIRNMINLLNNNPNILYNKTGEEIKEIWSLVNSPYNQTAQMHLQAFQDFMKSDQFYTFDIETLGNVVEGEKFSITEIAAQGFKKNGDTIIPTDQKLSLVIAPTEIEADIRETIQKLRQNPYGFNTLEEWKQRTLIDLIRYSTLGNNPAQYNKLNNEMIDLKHNPAAQEFFDKGEHILNRKVISNMPMVLNHIESGLNNLLQIGINGKEGLKRYRQFLLSNESSYFVSYNGDMFDLPALRAWASQHKETLLDPAKHLDYYQLIRTVFPNAAELHAILGRKLKDNPFDSGMFRLQEFRKTLGFDQIEAHTALFDIGEHGLGGLINASMNIIHERLLKSKTTVPNEFGFYDTVFSWSNQRLKVGQKLFSVGGVQAVQDGSLSFKAVYDQESGVFKPISNSFYSTVINSKAFYEVRGLADLSRDQIKRYALVLWDPDEETYSFIVREGDRAMEQLAGFVQRRFYNWNGLTKEQRKEIQEYKLTDSARRRHLRMFSLEKAGTGKTGGYNAAKRLYENTAIAEQRILGKSKNKGTSIERITHEELEQLLEGRFNSLWDPETKTWKHNQFEKDDFFRMINRLIDERPIYQPAIEYIGQELQDPQQRDLAWKLYTEKVQQYLQDQGYTFDTEIVDLKQFERKRIQMHDYFTNKNFSLNFESFETLNQGIWRYVNSDLDNTLKKEELEDRRREKIYRFIENLKRSDIIDQQFIAAHNLMELNANSRNAYNTINQLTTVLMDAAIQFEETREQISLSSNKAIQNLNPEINYLLMQEAVKHVKDMKNVHININQVPGSKAVFSSEIEKYFNRLDQTHLSGLSPNNREAVESLLESVYNQAQKNGLNFSLSLDETNNIAKISIYDPENYSAVEHLLQGKKHPRVLDIEIPLISELGVHSIGKRRLNARMYADYINGQVVFKSSAQYITENYIKHLSNLLDAAKQGNYELANKRARRVLNESVEQLSGIQRNLVTSGDLHFYNATLSDFFKQGQVDIQRAMIKEMFDRGELKPSDFYTNAFDNGELKQDISIDDLKPKKAFEVLIHADDWFKRNQLDLFSSSVKGEHVGRMIFGMQDIRDYLVYGHYINQARDNSVQFMNTYLVNQNMIENLNDIATKNGLYINFNDLIVTPKQDQLNQIINKQFDGYKTGANIKIAFMNDEELFNRIMEIGQSEKGKQLLIQEGIMNPDGTYNWQRMPRVYEQQGLIVRDIRDALKVQEMKFVGDLDQFELAEGVEEGSTIKPGQLIGYDTTEGIRREVRWDQKHEGKLFSQDGRLGVLWNETAFKYIIEGEKATDFAISRDLMREIVGDDKISMILNANIQKHKDYGMWMSGKAKLLADHTRQLAIQLQKAEMDKASALGQKRFKIRDELNKAIELAKDLGLEWDEANLRFLQVSNPTIEANRFDEILNELGIQSKTNLGFETAILEQRLSKVSNYSKMIDYSGREVISVFVDDKGYTQKIYGKESGVKWGHREMGVLQDLGLTKTYNHVLQLMKEQSSNKNRFSETVNITKSLEGFIHQSDEAALTIDQFRSLPELEGNKYTYKGTIFDREQVYALLGNNRSTHGYWLELPTMTDINGAERQITVNLFGTDKHGNPLERKKINKIFIPFTHLDETNGKIYLRELQSKIADIYRRAREVEETSTYEERSKAMNRLQTAVDDYIDRLVFDITSSKGLTGESTLKAFMPKSGTGLFKLIDPRSSLNLEGDYTFISKEDARKMGIYEKLVSIEAKRKAGEVVDDLYIVNTRYPTFHSNAMQISKIRLDETLKPGEFHTTAFMSDLMKADSDGDYNNIVFIDKEEIQDEWKRLYEHKQKQQEEKLKQFMENYKQKQGSRKFGATDILENEKYFTAFNVNSQEELAAKIGKRVIGQASNLNLAMRQLADEYLSDNEELKQAMKKFGQDIEQKLISSKHGMTIAKGSAPALDFIYAISNHNWKEARQLHSLYFADDFDKETMEKTFRGLNLIKQYSKEGLKNNILRFGTSYGLDTEKLGLQKIVDMIHGNLPNNENILSNSHLNLLRNMLDINVSKTYTDLEGNTYQRVTPYKSLEEKLKEPRQQGFLGFFSEMVHDLSGNMIPSAEEKTKNILQDIAKNKGLKRGLIAGALALGGLAGYNILRHDEPLVPEQPRDQEYSYDDSNVPPIEEESYYQNADIQIKATGAGHDPSQISQMVEEGMRQSYMRAGPAHVIINHKDNTSRLNRFWYRDKIEENM